MKKTVMKLIKRSSFDFSFPNNVVAIFLNPFYFVRRNLYRKAKEYSLELDGRLLDFGCGCKPYMKMFTKVTEYIGLDIDDRGLDHTGSEIDVYYDGNTIPFEDGYFDSVFSTEVYEHVPNLETIMPEINRVLKMGGRMLVTAPFVWNEHGLPYDFQRFTKYGLKNLLESYGFEIIKSDTSTSYIEMIFQLWMEYIRHSYRKLCDKRIFTLIIQLLFIFPVAFLGSIINFVLPDNNSLYGDSVIICKKIKDTRLITE